MPVDHRSVATPDDLDEYIAELLKNDPERHRSRLANGGVSSTPGARPRGNAPKPNTRFLRNILRETDSHNAALRAKEEREAEERRRGLKRRPKHNVDLEGEHETKRRRGGDVERTERHGGDGIKHQRDRSRSPCRSEATRRERRRSTSPKRDRHRHRHDRRSRSRSPRRDDTKPRKRAPTRRKTPSPSPATSDSDPHDSAIGPLPARKSAPRGRGAHQDPSATDARFAKNYDPSADIGSDDGVGDEDRDMALERAAWRRTGAERLRAAGFSETDVKRWEGDARAGREKDASDVRWSKRGEDREWDRGKVADAEGGDVRANWIQGR